MRLGWLVVVLCLAGSARAASIVLTTTNNGTYQYGLQVDLRGELLTNGQTITLAGLSGVTGASLGLKGPNGTISFTSTSVTITENAGQTDDYPGYSFSYIYSDFFRLTSTLTTPGAATYFINGTPASSGTVYGPVEPAVTAMTPEPSSLILLGTGLLGVLGAARRRMSV